MVDHKTTLVPLRTQQETQCIFFVVCLQLTVRSSNATNLCLSGTSYKSCFYFLFFTHSSSSHLEHSTSFICLFQTLHSFQRHLIKLPICLQRTLATNPAFIYVSVFGAILIFLVTYLLGASS